MTNPPVLKTRPVHGGNIAWAAEVAGCSPFDVLDFSASICPLGPPDRAIAALHDSIAHLSRYPDPQYTALTAALAQHHQILPEWVLPGNGAAELLTWAGRDLAAQDATYLITPAFRDYGRSLHAFHGRPVCCPLPLAEAEHGIIDWAGLMTRHLRHDPRQCGLLLNTPHNPTGLLIDPAAIAPLLDQFGLVVIDEAFMDFLPPEAQRSFIATAIADTRVVVLRSLTKFYSLPGLRLGYAIAHPDRLQRWQQWRDPWPVNTLAEAAAIAALPDEAYAQRVWAWLPPTRYHLSAGLRRLPGLHPFPGSANYLLVRTTVSATALQRALLQRHRILIRDCLSFPELGDAYVRIAVRTEADCDRLLAALADVLTEPLLVPESARDLPRDR